MKRNKPKSSRTGGSLISAIITGVITASLLSVLLTALLANFVLHEHLGEESAGVAAFVIRAASLFVGAFVGARVLKKDYLKLIGIIMAGYLLMLIGTGVVLYDESFKHFISGLTSVLFGGAAALVILLRPKVNKHRRVKISL